VKIVIVEIQNTVEIVFVPPPPREQSVSVDTLNVPIATLLPPPSLTSPVAVVKKVRSV